MGRTNREAAHAWRMRHERGCHSNNLTYDPAALVLRSYATPVARWARNGAGGWAALILPCAGLSMTTKTQHLSHLRDMGSAAAFRVPDLHPEWAHHDNLVAYLKNIDHELGRARRARLHKEHVLHWVARLTDEASAYCRFFSLADPFRPATERDHLQAAALQGDEVARAALLDLEYERGMRCDH